MTAGAKKELKYGAAALKILKELLALKDKRLVDAGAIRKCLPLRGDALIAHDINLVTEVKSLVHRFPLRAYKDQATRQILLDGIQSLLDQLVDREDELLAEEDEG